MSNYRQNSIYFAVDEGKKGGLNPSRDKKNKACTAEGRLCDLSPVVVTLPGGASTKHVSREDTVRRIST